MVTCSLDSQDGDLTLCSPHSTMTSETTQCHDNHREHIQVAPLIDFEGEPTVTSSSQHNGVVGPVIDLTEDLSDRLLLNGDTPLISVPNDRASNLGLAGKNVLNSEWSTSASEVGREEEVGGSVEGDMLAAESVSGSQELF